MSKCLVEDLVAANRPRSGGFICRDRRSKPAGKDLRSLQKKQRKRRESIALGGGVLTRLNQYPKKKWPNSRVPSRLDATLVLAHSYRLKSEGG